MVGGLIVFSMLAVWTIVEFFTPDSPKTPEEKLGEALTEYLKAGVKLQGEGKEKK